VRFIGWCAGSLLRAWRMRSLLRWSWTGRRKKKPTSLRVSEPVN